ncbi:hypothetical protein L1987_49304 [Smallanthus sonchifolius]|uniref:Uncharacterized protein n=1 Tax=Smallanthus sonchifolius TaxID=185202 RepID=A0ACB9FUD0_9ASTR|nr:hypothetical protein L1987_49304 [Smallanthus sonchifolius]
MFTIQSWDLSLDLGSRSHHPKTKQPYESKLPPSKDYALSNKPPPTTEQEHALHTSSASRRKYIGTSQLLIVLENPSPGKTRICLLAAAIHDIIGEMFWVNQPERRDEYSTVIVAVAVAEEASKMV